MSKVIAIMSMSLDGYVADPNDGVGEVFDWYNGRRPTRVRDRAPPGGARQGRSQ